MIIKSINEQKMGGKQAAYMHRVGRRELAASLRLRTQYLQMFIRVC